MEEGEGESDSERDMREGERKRMRGRNSGVGGDRELQITSRRVMYRKKMPGSSVTKA